MMASQTYGRLGDQRTAARMAHECVAMAEQLGDRAVCWPTRSTRLGNALLAESPAQARAAVRRGAGAVRGDRRRARPGARLQQPWHRGACSRRRLDEAQQAFGKAIAVARAAGIPDFWGLAALNLGVLSQKLRRLRSCARAVRRGARAVRGGEAQRISVGRSVQHGARRAGARAVGVGGALYDATIPLAQRIGQSDIEIGATAGAGLCFLELGAMGMPERLSRMSSRG